MNEIRIDRGVSCGDEVEHRVNGIVTVDPDSKQQQLDEFLRQTMHRFFREFPGENSFEIHGIQRDVDGRNVLARIQSETTGDKRWLKRNVVVSGEHPNY